MGQADEVKAGDELFGWVTLLPFYKMEVVFKRVIGGDQCFIFVDHLECCIYDVN